MSNLFYGCSDLITLPNISKWNLKTVKSLKQIFYEYRELKTLPNILEYK